MTDRPYTTGLYLLRCTELGLSPSDLCLIDYGMVTDMLIESSNDNETWTPLATQDDFDRF